MVLCLCRAKMGMQLCIGREPFSCANIVYLYFQCNYFFHKNASLFLTCLFIGSPVVC